MEDSPLFAASERLAHAPAFPQGGPYTRLTPEERAAHKAHARSLSLRSQALARLYAGEPCTKTQAPFVGEWIKDAETQIATLKAQLRTAEAQIAERQAMEARLIPQWNSIFELFRDQLGITLYADGSWKAVYQAQEAQGREESLAKAMHEALLWRFSQGW